MTPDEFYERYIVDREALDLQPPKLRQVWAVRASVADVTDDKAPTTKIVGRVVGRIAGGRIIPME